MMDTLDINDAHYGRKILDLQRRYDEQYDTIEEIEAQMDEPQGQIRSIQQEKISGDHIYQPLLAFDEVCHSATKAEQKEFMEAFIERIELFPEKRKDGNWIKKIVFNFPVPVDGEEVKELPLETEFSMKGSTNEETECRIRDFDLNDPPQMVHCSTCQGRILWKENILVLKTNRPPNLRRMLLKRSKQNDIIVV